MAIGVVSGATVDVECEGSSEILFSSVLGVGMDCEGGLGFVEKRELKKFLSKQTNQLALFSWRVLGEAASWTNMLAVQPDNWRNRSIHADMESCSQKKLLNELGLEEARMREELCVLGRAAAFCCSNPT